MADVNVRQSEYNITQMVCQTVQIKPWKCCFSSVCGDITMLKKPTVSVTYRLCIWQTRVRQTQ